MENQESNPENTFFKAEHLQDFNKLCKDLKEKGYQVDDAQNKTLLRGVLLRRTSKEIADALKIKESTFLQYRDRLGEYIKGITKVERIKEWSRLPELLEEKGGYNLSHTTNSHISENIGSNSGKDENAQTNPQTNELKLQEDYIQPPQFEFCLNQISIPGCLLRIKAPIRIGKKTLIDNILNCANKNYRTTTLSLRMAEYQNLESLDTFLQWFCTKIAQGLKLSINIEDYWNSQIGNSKMKCMAYFEDHLLLADQPLILAIYRLDKVYPYSEIAGEFFSLLQTWHEEAKNRNIWKQLRLIVTYRENYNKIQPHRSPFNKGTEILLSYLKKEQVKSLAEQYKNNNFNDEQIQKLMDMVGGHPDLVKLALNKIIDGTMEIEKLLNNTDRLDEIYGDHLNEYLRYFEIYPKRKEAFKKIVTADLPVEFKSVSEIEIVESLRDLGLIKIEGENVEPRNKLYRLYFRDRL
ncbi:AAA-like domain-containing protein [Argonema antarcticum]|uniref:AAA-like domain-containing protein n=1 Tax=Argonema antarcticum TaxID=2942763 RepID=UPI00201362E3|nr:AAA-like domain-containing protein [Argonema antarcticum]MCL1474146.1 AAA-like domain-containing protein [Argonema antarcticum A004/B2]